MGQYNVIYRALKNISKQMSSDKDIGLLFDAIKRSSMDEDRLEAERTYCIVDENWVQKIEKELVYVGKAVEEDRQFIVSNGEVVPIEKIKKVSTATVRHLARHCNLITHLPKKNEELVPEKLYMVENLTDYAVYENRFLYMLLCYLRDFIALRLQDIVEIGNTFRSKTTVKKDVRYRKRHLVYEAKILDEDKADPLSEKNSQSANVIERIENSYRIVCSLLNTPLMREVSKVPMIKPPVTKTNVLKMNNNFVHAMELYHYVSSYTEKGYKVEMQKTTYAPFSDSLLNEMSQVIAINTYIGYKYGNKLFKDLDDAYKKEEALNAEVEKRNASRDIKALKKRLLESGEDINEYFAKLEKINASLEKAQDNFLQTRAELDKANETLAKLQAENTTLKKDAQYFSDELEKKINLLISYEQKRLSELSEVERKHQEELQDLRNRTEVEVNNAQAMLKQKDEECLLKIQAEQRIFEARQTAALREQESLLEKEKEKFLDECRQKIDEEAKRASIIERDASDKMFKMQNDCDAEVDRIKREKQVLLQEKSRISAQLSGLRQKNGLISPQEDYTSKEKFDELEMEFDAFIELFKTRWEQTKKKIRKDILWKLSKDSGKKVDEAEFMKTIQAEKQSTVVGENTTDDENN